MNLTLYTAAFGTGVTIGLLVLLRLVQRVIERQRGLRASNEAHRMLQVGDVLGTFIVAAAVVKNNVTGESLAHDLTWTAAFGVLGLVVVQAAGHLSARTLLKGQLFAELDRGNPAAGLAASAHVVATGILAAPAMAGGDLESVGLALFFFALALATHVAFMVLFRALTTYDDAEQIQGENTAAAISYAGLSVALSVLIARGVEGQFVGWLPSLKGYLGVVACGLAFYPVRQIVVQGLLLGTVPSLRGGALDGAIAVERSEAMATLEAVTYVATAWAIASLA